MPGRPQLFRSRVERPRGQAHRDYERRRGSARERGYGPEWDKASAAFRCGNPLCIGCLALGWSTSTEVTDHIEPHRGDAEKFWNPANWQPGCGWHHAKVKQRLETMFAMGEIAVEDLKLDSAVAIRVARELIDAGEGPN